MAHGENSSWQDTEGNLLSMSEATEVPVSQRLDQRAFQGLKFQGFESSQ